MSSKPGNTVEFLDQTDFKDAYDLYQEVLDYDDSNFQLYYEFGVQFDDTQIPEWVKSDLINEPAGIGFSEQFLNNFGGINETINYCKPIIFYGFNNMQSIIFTFYTNENIFELIGITKSECIQQVIDYLNDEEIGFNITDNMIEYRQEYIYPSIVPSELEEDGWYDNLDALQGVNGVYYVGELISGVWILNVWDYQTTKFSSFYDQYLQL